MSIVFSGAYREDKIFLFAPNNLVFMKLGKAENEGSISRQKSNFQIHNIFY